MPYFGLSGSLCVALKADRRVFAATFLMAFLGAVLEILQGCVGRGPSVLDELANTLGAIMGATAGWLIVRFLKPKTLAACEHNQHLGA